MSFARIKGSPLNGRSNGHVHSACLAKRTLAAASGEHGGHTGIHMKICSSPIGGVQRASTNRNLRERKRQNLTATPRFGDQRNLKASEGWSWLRPHWTKQRLRQSRRLPPRTRNASASVAPSEFSIATTLRSDTSSGALFTTVLLQVYLVSLLQFFFSFFLRWRKCGNETGILLSWPLTMLEAK